MIYQGSRRHPVREAVIHCSATRPTWYENRTGEDKVREIRRWHVQENGWRNIGYHFLIDRDGKVFCGRKLTEIGAHVAGRNSGTIGICLIGGFGSNERDRFEQHFTEAQRTSLKLLVADLNTKTDLRTISGHNQYARKACPGFQVRREDWI